MKSESYTSSNQNVLNHIYTGKCKSELYDEDIAKAIKDRIKRRARNGGIKCPFCDYNGK